MISKGFSLCAHYSIQVCGDEPTNTCHSHLYGNSKQTPITLMAARPCYRVRVCQVMEGCYEGLQHRRFKALKSPLAVPGFDVLGYPFKQSNEYCSDSENSPETSNNRRFS